METRQQKGHARTGGAEKHFGIISRKKKPKNEKEGKVSGGFLKKVPQSPLFWRGRAKKCEKSLYAKKCEDRDGGDMYIQKKTAKKKGANEKKSKAQMILKIREKTDLEKRDHMTQWGGGWWRKKGS